MGCVRIVESKSTAHNFYSVLLSCAVDFIIMFQHLLEKKLFLYRELKFIGSKLNVNVFTKVCYHFPTK